MISWGESDSAPSSSEPGEYATKTFSLRFKSPEFCPAEAGNCWRLSIEWLGQTNFAPARPVRIGLVNADLRCARARARRDITVPSGICSRLAISRYCISETTAMSSTSRNCGGIPSMAAAKWWSVKMFVLALVAAAQVSRIS